MNDTIFTPAPAVDQVVTRDAAPAAIEQLRADRLNGRVSESAYLQRSEYLHGVMASDPAAAPPAPPKAFETQDERYARSIDEQMTAPAAEKYINLPSAEAFGDRAQEVDAGMTRVLARAGIPQAYAPQMLENVYRQFGELAELDAGSRQAKLASVQAELKSRWGDEFQARLDRVNNLLADAMEADDTISHAFDQAPWAFHTDVWVMESLDRIAQHRARRGA